MARTKRAGVKKKRRGKVSLGREGMLEDLQVRDYEEVVETLIEK